MTKQKQQLEDKLRKIRHSNLPYWQRKREMQEIEKEIEDLG